MVVVLYLRCDVFGHFGNATWMASQECDVYEAGQQMSQVGLGKQLIARCTIYDSSTGEKSAENRAGLVAAAGTTTWAAFRVSCRRCGS